MGDSEAQRAILELTVSTNLVSFVYDNVPIRVYLMPFLTSRDNSL